MSTKPIGSLLLTDIRSHSIWEFTNSEDKQGSGLLLSHLMLMLFLIFEKYDNKRPDTICAYDPICAYVRDGRDRTDAEIIGTYPIGDK